jgi:acetyl-CoA carboxylase biotin carboxyl carrier protein
MTKPRKPAPKTAVTKSKTSATETVELVRELATILSRRRLAELIVELPEATITLRSGSGMQPQMSVAPQPMPAMMPPPAPAPAAHADPAPRPPSADDDSDAADERGNGKYQVVKSPFVGTFYRSPSPDADPFIEVGSRVEKGQVLCIVEAMKLMNEIEAEHSGVISACLVENAQPVEYGQALFKISAA